MAPASAQLIAQSLHGPSVAVFDRSTKCSGVWPSLIPLIRVGFWLTCHCELCSHGHIDINYCMLTPPNQVTLQNRMFTAGPGRAWAGLPNQTTQIVKCFCLGQSRNCWLREEPERHEMGMSC